MIAEFMGRFCGVVVILLWFFGGVALFTISMERGHLWLLAFVVFVWLPAGLAILSMGDDN